MGRSFHTKLAGVTKKNEDGERRQEIIELFVSVGDLLLLERESYNEYDANAVAVYTGTASQIGYLPGSVAEEIAPILDAGDQVVYCTVTDITGGEPGRSFGVNVLIEILTPEESLPIIEKLKANKPTAPAAVVEVVKEPAPVQSFRSDPSYMAPAKAAPAPVFKENRSTKNFWVTLILAIFLGYLGAHRFYVGRGNWLYTLTLGYGTIGWLIDVVMIAIGKFADGQGRLIPAPFQ